MYFFPFWIFIFFVKKYKNIGKNKKKHIYITFFQFAEIFLIKKNIVYQNLWSMKQRD